MANPFDDFDTPTASAEGNPFDSFDAHDEGILDTLGKIPAQLKKSYDLYKEPYKAGVEAVATLASGAGAFAAAPFVAGLQSLSGKYNDPQEGGFPLNYANDINDMTYSPKTPMGKVVGEHMGEAINQLLIPLSGMHLGGVKELAAEGKVNNAKFGRAADVPVPKLKDLTELSKEVNVPDLKAGEQGNLFDQFDTTGHTSPYDAGQQGITEPSGLHAKKAQMDLQLEHPETQVVTPEGVSLPASQAEPALQARNKQQDAMIAQLDAEHAANNPVPKGQMDMFGQGDTVASPYDAGQAGVTEPVNFNRSRQQDLPFGNDTTIALGDRAPTPLDAGGQLGKQRADALAAQLSEQGKADAFAKAGQAEMFPPNTNQHRAYTDRLVDDGKGGARPMTKAEYTKTIENLSKEPSTRFQAPDNVDAAYKAYLDDVNSKQGGLFDIGSKQAAFDRSPAQRAEAAIAKQVEAIQELRSNIKDGSANPHELIGAMSKLEALKERSSIIADNLAKKQEAATPTAALDTPPAAKPSFNTRTRKQGGGLFMGDSAKKQLGDVDPRLTMLLKDKSTNEEFLAAHQNTPDIKQNPLQKALNFGTKGGGYMVMKTKNPLIKRVWERFREANKVSLSVIQHLVHDKMEPAARALNDTEKADAWAAQMIQQHAKQPLTPEAMKKYGFNDKQVAWGTLHADVAGKMYERMKTSMEAAGMEVVSPQVAYAASRASKDFRRIVTDPSLATEITGPAGPVVHMLTSDTRRGLNIDMAKYKLLEPNRLIHEEQYYGGNGTKNSMAEGMDQMLNFLSKNDPHIKEMVDQINEQATADAFNYMNVKSHTMAKKGITGMEGNKINLDTAHPDAKQAYDLAVQNAKEGMRAMNRYTENMIKWSELSEAVKDTKDIMSPNNGLNMPNAKEYMKNYIDTALGRNPTSIGRQIDALAATIGDKLGIGTHLPHAVLSGIKQVKNAILLGMSPMFLMMNKIQPYRTTPGMMAWAKDIGLKKDFDFGTGYKYLGKAAVDMVKDRSGEIVDPVIKGALEYADSHHVYSSDLFETGGDVSNTLRLRANKVTQFGVAQVERDTRQSVYLAFTHMLHENGLEGETLYHAAAFITDDAMNNYSHQEAPMMYNVGGAATRNAFDLMSYKHNELSRISMLAREIPAGKSMNPLFTEMIAQVAFAGIKGAILYPEADQIVRFISDKMGHPTSLTKLLLDAHLPQTLTHGMFAAIGGDMSGRMSMNVVPGSVVDAVMPGAGKLVDIAKDAGDMAFSPGSYNAAKLAQVASPALPASLIDRGLLSKKDGNGDELAFNKETVEATAKRNTADKIWKTLGGTGINEAVQKATSYENNDQAQKYQEHRKAAVNNMAKEFFMSGKIPASLTQRYMNYQGDPATLEKDIETMAEKQAVPKYQLQLLKSAASNSITAIQDIKRRTK